MQSRATTAYDIFYCPLFGSKVNEAQCHSQTVIFAKNAEYCSAKRCTSPWRVCFVCVKQGKQNKTFEYGTGLCKFHAKYGKDAVEGRIGEIVIKGINEQTTGFIPRAGFSIRDLIYAARKRIENLGEEYRQREVVANPGELVLDRQKIIPDPEQPRQYFDEEALLALMESIIMIGQLVPITVKADENKEGHWIIEDGERRWIACGLAGISKLKAIVSVVKDKKKSFIRSAAANFGREPHNDLEIARAFRRIMLENDLNPLQLARAVACKVSYVMQRLSILKLDRQVQSLMEPTVPKEKRIHFQVALLLTSFPNELQVKLAEEITRRQMKPGEARIFIRQQAEETGIKSGTGRARKPADDHKAIRLYLLSIEGKIRLLKQFGEDLLKKVFERQSITAFNEVIGMVRHISEDLNEIQKRLTKISDKK